MQLYFQLDEPALRELSQHPLFSEGPVTHERLTRIYHDTGDLALRELGLELSTVRRAGRWSQILARNPCQAPLAVEPVEGREADRTKLPVRGELGRQLDGALGDRPLQALFQVHLDRLSRELTLEDGARVELVLEHGWLGDETTRLPVATLNMSLLDGAPAALYELARGLAERWTLAPATPLLERGYGLHRPARITHHKAGRLELQSTQSTETAFVAILQACLDQARANRPAVLAGQVEGVHQMRVALRRLRAALKAFRDVVPRRASADLVAELRWLNGYLGPCRDWDVFITEGLEPMARRFPRRRALQRLLQRAGDLRHAHYRNLHQALEAPRYHRLMLDAGAWLAGRAWRASCDQAQRQALDRPVTDFAAGLLKRLHRRVVRQGERFSDLSVPERHALRIRIKELRYGLEFFAALYPPKAVARYRSAASALQDSLGVLNDIATGETLLDEAGQGPATPVRSLVEGWYGCKLELFEAGFPAAWKAFRRCRRPWKVD